MKKRVVLAMSGGVDSSTAAYVLLKEGYDVIGISLKLFDNKEGSRCCGIQGIDDARAVASKLGIPFYVLNYKKEFEEKVIEPFCEAYKEGRTPNPCIICNERIKFDSLLKKAKILGANYVATGHYVRIAYDKKGRRFFLRKAKDRIKDQSYFLYSLSQHSLLHALFPLAEFSKEEVRRLAKKIGIKVHSKPASQEICFIPEGDYKNFLIEKDNDVLRPGLIVDKEGKILGRHKGIAFYTIGQRRGLGIAHKRPLYVLSIDREKNLVVVGEEEETYSNDFVIGNINWMAISGIDDSLKVKAMIRYNHEPSEAVLCKLDSDKLRVRFIRSQRSVTPGQACVFYRRDMLLGGGTIFSTLFSTPGVEFNSTPGVEKMVLR